jgi:signal transduction histidine kinase
MQSGRIELEKSPVDLNALINELLVDIEFVASEYGISVVRDIGDDLPIVLVDEEKISRLLTNLLDNAVKFSPEDGVVRLSVRSTQEEIQIEVWDQGPGVAEEHRKMIFERFTQISGQFGRWRGAGLGLSFSRLTIEAHGGKIWVEDVPEGSGSLFRLTLPISFHV